MITATVLCLMALADGGLSGFRTAAGRNAMVRKERYYATAVARGVGAAIVALGVLGGAITVALVVAPDPAERYEDLVAAGQRMLLLYVLYTFVVLSALAGLAIPRFEVRSLLTSLILGPCTLIRPLVIMAGAVLAGIGAHDPTVASLAWLAALVMLAIEFAVARLWYRDLRLPAAEPATGTIGR